MGSAATAAASPLPGGLVVWLDATTVLPTHSPIGTHVAHWSNRTTGSATTKLLQPVVAMQPTYDPDGFGSGHPSVHFSGTDALVGSLVLSAERTILWVLKDEGSATSISSGES